MPGTKINVKKLSQRKKLTESGGGTDMTLVKSPGFPPPVEYSWAPAAGEEWFLREMKIIFQDPGSKKPTDFGSAPSLSNGILWEIKAEGTLYEVAVIQDNTDFAFAIDSFEDLAAGGFINDSSTILGSNKWDDIPLIGDAGDYVKWTIRDDLDFIKTLSVSAMVWSP